MDFLYYFKQWPGSFTDNIIRIFHVLYLEVKRIIFGIKYIAEFDLTDRCNLSCAHCYHFRRNSKLDYTELSSEIWKQKFKILKKEGIRRVLLIGGEPSLRKDIIAQAHSFFKYVDICTNGLILIESKNNQKLFVSIDGDNKTHDSIRGEGVFKKVLNNYKNDKRVVFSMTLTIMNWQQLEDVVKIAIDNGVRGVSCDIYTPSPVVNESDKFYINKETRELIINELLRMKKKYPDVFLMSRKAIMWFKEADHKGKACYWRQAVKHFDVNLEERFSCKDLDCAHCGHFAQANLSPLNFFINNG